MNSPPMSFQSGLKSRAAIVSLFSAVEVESGCQRIDHASVLTPCVHLQFLSDRIERFVGRFGRFCLCREQSQLLKQSEVEGFGSLLEPVLRLRFSFTFISGVIRLMNLRLADRRGRRLGLGLGNGEAGLLIVTVGVAVISVRDVEVSLLLSEG